MRTPAASIAEGFMKRGKDAKLRLILAKDLEYGDVSESSHSEF
jgi:hypothetical protein